MRTIRPFRLRSCMEASRLARCWGLRCISAPSRCFLPLRGITRAGRSEKIGCRAGLECPAVTTATLCGSVWEERRLCLDLRVFLPLRRGTGRQCIARWKLRSAWTSTLCSPPRQSLAERCYAASFSLDSSRPLRHLLLHRCVSLVCASCFYSLAHLLSPVGIGQAPLTSQSNFWPG